MKSLDPPHKGLRNALGILALLAGKTNYQNKDEVIQLQSIGKEVFHLLKDHTLTENKFILAPLEQKVPGFTADYLSDHQEIDLLENSLLNRLIAFNGQQTDEEGHLFYLDICNFQSQYLEHIDAEDIELEQAMQQNFTDEELISHQIEIMKEMSFETLLLWFKYIVPARRSSENAQVLTGFKSSAPAEAYEAVVEVIRQVISEDEWSKIKNMIA